METQVLDCVQVVRLVLAPYQSGRSLALIFILYRTIRPRPSILIRFPMPDLLRLYLCGSSSRLTSEVWRQMLYRDHASDGRSVIPEFSFCGALPLADGALSRVCATVY